MTINEINANERVLKPLIDRALLKSVELVFKMCSINKTRPQEPDFVASLSLSFTRDLFDILRLLFPHFNISVTGVYCHQRPIVDIGEAKSPEIGDLLLVYRERNFGTDRLNSLLLQAKTSSKQTLQVSSDEQHQLKLYENWPKFTYRRAGKLNGITRDILPKTINDGSQYLLIDTDPMTNGLMGLGGTFPMGCAIANETLILHSNFTDEIFDFLKFKAGRAFEHRHSSDLKDDWSNMVWDLISMSKSVKSKRRNIGLGSFPRVNEHVFFCTEGSWQSSLYLDIHNNNLSDISKDYDYEEHPNGVSIILIESSPEEGEYSDW